MNKIALAAISLFLGVSTTFAKDEILFNTGWQFALGPTTESGQKADYPNPDQIKKEFANVTLPHTWNNKPVERMDCGESFYLSMGWYKKKFTASDEWKGRRVFIRFEGVGMECTIKLNGKSVGEHSGAYSAFCFEITDYLTFNQDNLLEVAVSNLRNPYVVPASDILQTRFGGIYRNVKLLVADSTCISPLDYASSGVYINQSNVSQTDADIDIDVLIDHTGNNSEYLVQAQIIDAENNIVKTIQEKKKLAIGTTKYTLSTSISNPRLWNGRRDPYMYRVEVAVKKPDGTIIDQEIQPLGIRYFEFTPDQGFFLNGEYLDVYGVSRWQDWAEEGFATTAKQDSFDVSLMEELNCTGIRFACYQQSETMYNLMDSKGFVTIAELPLTPPEVDTEEFYQSCREQLKELIKQLYNHPSIIVWNLLNEVKPTYDHLEGLNNLAHELDNGRPTMIVYNQMNTEEKIEIHGITDIIGTNRYPWWYSGKASWMFKDELGNAGAFKDRYEGIIEYYPSAIVGITEYGAGGCIDQHQQNPEQPDPIAGRFFPEEYQTQTHEKQYALLRDHQEYWCKLVWNIADFTWAYAKRGNAIGRNHKGLVTHDRKVKKDVFYFYKAQWNQNDPTLYITSRRHVNRTEKRTPIKVYSNCEDVRLKVNGKRIEKVEKDDYNVYRWKDIELKPGVNKIMITGEWKGEKQVDTCEWIL